MSTAEVAHDAWLHAFRQGFAPSLSTPGLEALAKALRDDDPDLLQGATTLPPPLPCVQDWPVEGACAITYCGWKGDGLQTVGEAEEFFARTCCECDQRLGAPASCRFALTGWDETPRDEARELLLPVVEALLAERGGSCRV